VDGLDVLLLRVVLSSLLYALDDKLRQGLALGGHVQSIHEHRLAPGERIRRTKANFHVLRLVHDDGRPELLKLKPGVDPALLRRFGLKRLLPLVPLLERSLDGPLPHELFSTVVGDARLFRRLFDVPGVEIDELLLFVGKLRVGRALLPFSTSELVYLSSELTGQGTPHTASPTR